MSEGTNHETTSDIPSSHRFNLPFILLSMEGRALDMEGGVDDSSPSSALPRPFIHDLPLRVLNEDREREIGNSDTQKERDRRQDTSTPSGAPNLSHVISSDWMERSKWVSDHPQERERSNAIVHPSYSQSRSWSWSKNRTNPRWISICNLIPLRMRWYLSGLRNRKKKEKR